MELPETLIETKEQKDSFWLTLQFQNITVGTEGLAMLKPNIGSIVFSSKANYFYMVMG
jgi:hypothetical protein